MVKNSDILYSYYIFSRTKDAKYKYLDVIDDDGPSDIRHERMVDAVQSCGPLIGVVGQHGQ